MSALEGKDFLLQAVPLHLSFDGSLRKVKSGSVFDPSVLC